MEQDSNTSTNSIYKKTNDGPTMSPTPKQRYSTISPFNFAQLNITECPDLKDDYEQYCLNTNNVE